MTSEEAIARARDWLDRRPRTGAHEIVESLLAALSTPAAPAQDDALVADGKKLLAMILGPCKQRLEHEWHKCKRCILMEELGYPGDSLAKRALASLLSAPPAAPPVVHPSEIPHDIRATVHSSQSDARGADSPAANAGVRSVESCGRGDDRDRATVAAPPVGEAERQAAMLDADAALMEKEAPGSWAVAPPPADLVALVRRVMNAYTRELEARNAWVISAPQSRESFELFEVVQAREADTRAAFLALHAYPLPEVPDGK